MPLEIERKFLLVDNAWRHEVSRRRVMRQGYLAGVEGRASVRVRLDDTEARLNIKAAVVGSARAEYDYDMPPGEAQEILDHLCVGRIDKTRHYVERDGFTWEIDEFHGDNDGLIVAEIELENEAQWFPRPAWLGREVTDQRRYYNHSLALHPYRNWDAS
ncbi:CYTH domain-containing protein [Panacagrimonas sp.]|uniref:CYTH domain-containing protein n=1 Tax=Panacagrimonas sp. TaxID=2480088 RepID=UPI003B52EC96